MALIAQSNVVDGKELTNRVETFLKDEFIPMIESIRRKSCLVIKSEAIAAIAREVTADG